MRKLSESFVDDIIRRGITGEERKEDEIPNSNFKEIDFIDCGCSVLWADKDLIIDGNDIFDKNEKDIICFPPGYRYPTEDEFWELCETKDERVYKPNQDNTIRLKDIYFNKGHYFLGGQKRLIEISITCDDRKMTADTCSDVFCTEIKIRLVKEQ